MKNSFWVHYNGPLIEKNGRRRFREENGKKKNKEKESSKIKKKRE